MLYHPLAAYSVTEKTLSGMEHSMTSCHLLMQTLLLQVVEMWWHADELHGLIEVLDTPAGRLVRSLYCQGIMLGASSRGHSTLIYPPEGQKHTVVGSDWQLIT